MAHDSSSSDRQNRPDNQTRRHMLRSTVLLGTVGVLSGCESSAPPDDESTSSQTEGTTNSSPVRSTEDLSELTPPGERRPIDEKYPRLHVISKTPPVGETRERDTYTAFKTPIEDHYIVNHFETPVLNADEHTISLTSQEGKTIELSMPQLQTNYPSESVTHTMQCSGNGRAYFNPEISGYSLSFGALGTTIWTGTPLRSVFEQHELQVNGRWLTIAGADGPVSGSDHVYARSIPAWKALNDCILAYKVDGDPLPLEHGYPVRLIVPGWYGNNSVKWVSEIHITDGMVTDERRQYSEWQQHHYRLLPADIEETVHARIDEFDTWTQLESVVTDKIDYYPYMYDQTVKSLIGYPEDGTSLSPRRADGNVEIVGVTWAGDDRVDRIEVSTDGGETWTDAEFFGPDRGPIAWRQFRYLWDPSAGNYTLYSRATDEHGRIQPRTIASPDDGFETIKDGHYPWNQRGYGSNAYEELGVTVTVTTS